MDNYVVAALIEIIERKHTYLKTVWLFRLQIFLIVIAIMVGMMAWFLDSYFPNVIIPICGMCAMFLTLSALHTRELKQQLKELDK